jgi:hypothetical protein
MSQQAHGIAQAEIDGLTITVLVEGPIQLRARVEAITQRVSQAIDRELWTEQSIPACLRSASRG